MLTTEQKELLTQEQLEVLDAVKAGSIANQETLEYVANQLGMSVEALMDYIMEEDHEVADIFSFITEDTEEIAEVNEQQNS